MTHKDEPQPTWHANASSTHEAGDIRPETKERFDAWISDVISHGQKNETISYDHDGGFGGWNGLDTVVDRQFRSLSTMECERVEGCVMEFDLMDIAEGGKDFKSFEVECNIGGFATREAALEFQINCKSHHTKVVKEFEERASDLGSQTEIYKRQVEIDQASLSENEARLHDLLS